jgi:hypothetical protein
VCYTASRNQDPRFLHLQGDTHHLERSELLLAFAGSLWQGMLHGGRPPSGTSIEMTLREVAKFLGDPRRSTPGQPFIDTQFTDILQQWKMEDPAPQPQQALPSSTIRLIVDIYGKSQYKKQRVTADPIFTVYFLLLREGEYTPTAAWKGLKKRTIPLRRQDITFWKHARVIPPGTSLQTLLEADGVTINLANKKNGKKNAKLYHTHSGDDDFSPTKALAQLVHEIQDLHEESTNLGTYQEAGQAYQVTNKDIIQMVQHSAILDNLGASGFDQTRIGTHSL